MYKKILGPLDGSQLSECSLEHIKTIATGCQVPNVILLVVLKQSTMPSPPFNEVWGSREAVIDIGRRLREEESEIKQDAQKYLDKVADNLKKIGVQVQTAVIISELDKGVAETILDYAQNNEIDLIVMSTHGRSGISRFAFGSVADKVVRHANIPVLTIAPPGCRL